MSDLESVLADMNESLGSYKLLGKFMRFHPQWKVLGIALNRTGQFEKSLPIWQMIVDNDPFDPQNYVNLADAQCRREKINDAIATVKKMLKTFPESVSGHYLRFSVLDKVSTVPKEYFVRECERSLKNAASLTLSGYCLSDPDYTCGVNSVLCVDPGNLERVFRLWVGDEGRSRAPYWAAKGFTNLFWADRSKNSKAHSDSFLKDAASDYSRAANLDRDDPIYAKTLAEIAQRLGDDKMYSIWSGRRDARAIDYFTSAKSIKRFLM